MVQVCPSLILVRLHSPLPQNPLLYQMYYVLPVSELCKTNKVSIEFFDSCFHVKDQLTGIILMSVLNKERVYEWPSLSSLIKSPLVFASRSTSTSAWHQRLGYPSFRILQYILNKNSLTVTPNKFDSFYNSCACHKSHRLPFAENSLSSSKPLELIYTNVWSPAPITYHDNFRFYVIFMDHFTKYIWFYPMKQKSDVYDIFINFKILVENFFKTSIIFVFSYGGGEFIKLKPFFSKCRISHLTSPPYTPEHNGTSERRHRHIVETGLTLLHQASLSIRFWIYAFHIVVYLINRLPTNILKLESPYETLFGDEPNYNKIKIFGCQYFPWLHPYSTHELEPRSKPCIFLGYCTSQSAYKCFDIVSSRMYISRRVIFYESIFPYHDLDLSQTCVSTSSYSNWTPSMVAIFFSTCIFS